MKTDVILSAANDKYKLNSQRIAKMVKELDQKKPLDDIDKEVFIDLVRAKSLSDDNIAPLAKTLLKTIEKSDLAYYEDYIQSLSKKGIKPISILDDRYPDGLLNIEKPPLVLYVNGDLNSWNSGVAVVGTREAFDHRLEYIKKIGEKLVEMDRTVVSGLANGVDEAAHRSALNADGKTIAILPSHVENIYPKSNRPIGEKIPQNGALIGEVSKKVSINRGRFVERNRITSGLCDAVIIGASGETGGTIHQAKFAHSQNVPLLLYDPGNNDGQSPEKLDGLGAQRFKDVDEMEDLLTSVHGNSGYSENRTLDEYTS